MSSLLVVLPIVCCLLIPAVIGLAAFTFKRPKKDISDAEGQIEGPNQPDGQYAHNRKEPFNRENG
ncbi:MAG: hypothetical protein IH872_00045 [Chloroflexi bacterium]|nr:hypothetical protein [Chloroflexota bacterium]